MRYLLDTNIISDIVRFPANSAARRYGDDYASCFTSIIVAAEIRFGIAKWPERKGSLAASRFLDTINVVSFESPAEEEYGRLRAKLEASGTPIGANDLFIAAHALALEAILVTANEREFRRVPGLRVENWAAA